MLNNNNNNSSNLSDITDDVTFIKNILKDFYRTIIELTNFIDFEKISTDWINYKLEQCDKDPKRILEVMTNHQESKTWFTSFVGFFYQLGIGCDADKKKALEFYLLSTNNNNNH